MPASSIDLFAFRDALHQKATTIIWTTTIYAHFSELSTEKGKGLRMRYNTSAIDTKYGSSVAK